MPGVQPLQWPRLLSNPCSRFHSRLPSSSALRGRDQLRCLPEFLGGAGRRCWQAAHHPRCHRLCSATRRPTEGREEARGWPLKALSMAQQPDEDCSVRGAGSVANVWGCAMNDQFWCVHFKGNSCYLKLLCGKPIRHVSLVELASEVGCLARGSMACKVKPSGRMAPLLPICLCSPGLHRQYCLWLRQGILVPY